MGALPADEPRGSSGPDAEATAGAVAIETLREPDGETAVALLARAFRDNPLTLAIVGEDPARRLRSNLHGMRTLLSVAVRHGLVLGATRNARLVGALVAAPPFAYPLPPAAPLARLRCLLGQGWAVSTGWRRVFEQLDALHPGEPHWYLGTLGVDPPCQKSGVGRALLGQFTVRADRDPLPAYLETDRSENLSFYRRSGFETVGRTQILGVRIWRMLRAAVTP